MEDNKNLQFKTNINCGGCLEKATPFLNNAEGICHWQVNINDKDKVLTVHSKGITEAEVIAAVQKAGFKAEPLIA
ncbi:MAG: heavy-metal-associated domain-containing protein [Agriterribacter sp.]